MDTWTLQMGFPVINIKRDPKNADQALATQQRFIIDVGATDKDNS